MIIGRCYYSHQTSGFWPKFSRSFHLKLLNNCLQLLYGFRGFGPGRRGCLRLGKELGAGLEEVVALPLTLGFLFCDINSLLVDGSVLWFSSFEGLGCWKNQTV